MYAVGDRADRHLGAVEAGPQLGEHLAAHDAVKLGDAVAALGHPQPHVGHVEHRRITLGAELEDPFDGHARERAVTAEVALDQIHREAVDARGHGRVGREDGARAHGLLRLVERQAVRHQLADALDSEEAGVTLVGVEDLGLGVPGECCEGADRAYAPDAQQHLLVQPVLGGAAVEPVGDLALLGQVVLDVGVEQQQRDAADLGPPHVGVQGASARHADTDGQGSSLAVDHEGERQAVRVERGVALLLPALGVQGLLEVAGPVEQPDPEDRHAQVGRRLEVVTGEDAEAPGVLREHLGDAELRGEVGDRRRCRGRVADGLLRRDGRRGEVGREVVVGGPEPGEELVVRRQLSDAAGGDLGEQPHRVLLDRLPDQRVDRPEQLERRGVPRPPQVHAQLGEGRQGLRQGKADGEPAECSHLNDPSGSARPDHTGATTV